MRCSFVFFTCNKCSKGAIGSTSKNQRHLLYFQPILLPPKVSNCHNYEAITKLLRCSVIHFDFVSQHVKIPNFFGVSVGTAAFLETTRPQKASEISPNSFSTLHTPNMPLGQTDGLSTEGQPEGFFSSRVAMKQREEV